MTTLEDTIAIAVPIYSKHLLYGQRLLDSRRNTHNEHLKLVFGCSTKTEIDVLQLVVLNNGYSNVQFIHIPCDNIGNKAIYKKHKLLYELKETNDHIVCFDAETEFKKHIPAVVLMEKSLSPKLLGSRIQSLINERCLENFVDDVSDVEWGDVYFWFSDVPIYNNVCLKEFYKEFTNLEKLCECYEHFEHILYVYFIMLRCDEKTLAITKPEIIDIGDTYGIYTGWSLENCSANIFKELLLKKAPMPLWCSPQCYNDLDEEYRRNIYLCYHLDR